jgi:hypothetical protein
MLTVKAKPNCTANTQNTCRLTGCRTLASSSSFFYSSALTSAARPLYLNKPSYNIRCVVDNVLNAFEPFQTYFMSRALILLSEVAIFVLTFACAVAMAWHWLKKGETFEYPTAILLFYVLKLVTDVSLVLERPHNTLWSDINLGIYTIRYDDWFLSNVDPYAGLLLFAFIYATQLSSITRDMAWNIVGLARCRDADPGLVHRVRPAADSLLFGVLHVFVCHVLSFCHEGCFGDDFE